MYALSLVQPSQQKKIAMTFISCRMCKIIFNRKYSKLKNHLFYLLVILKSLYVLFIYFDRSIFWTKIKILYDLRLNIKEKNY